MVAVVDTGIQADHAFLVDNIYVPNNKATFTHFGYDFSISKKTSTTPSGTHRAGIIKSVFPEVNFDLVKKIILSSSLRV